MRDDTGGRRAPGAHLGKAGRAADHGTPRQGSASPGSRRDRSAGGLVTARELAAARIHDPALRAAYAECRRLNARHGRTYFLATRLLPLERRSAVHALYG
ncbi:hypothetical protein ACFC17_40620, partial [Streptomyces hydrogenans]